MNNLKVICATHVPPGWQRNLFWQFQSQFSTSCWKLAGKSFENKIFFFLLDIQYTFQLRMTRAVESN